MQGIINRHNGAYYGYDAQQLVYLPFGELRSNREYFDIKINKPYEQHWVDLKYNTQQFETPYKFNGKEKDLESGYNYYGARYYYDWLSIWLSVDPLSDKYPHVTNYVYCSNNPVMVVDPDGRDEWELNTKGEIIKRITNKKEDSFHVMDKNGNRSTDKSIGGFEYGTIKEMKNKDLTMFRIQGDKNATSIFEFMAKNTDVEWTHAKVGEEKSGKNVIGTSHSASSTKVGHYLRMSGWTLREVNHNHPNGHPFPSDYINNRGERKGDVPNAALYEKDFPKIKLHIYTVERGYYRYNSKTEKTYNGGVLEEIIISGQ